MTRLPRAVLLAMLTCVPWTWSFAADGGGGFSTEQRAAIVSIVRDALKQDPSILRDAVTALQADDNAKSQAATHAAIAGLHDTLVLPTDPVVGNPNGDVTIVEFFDTRCPYCRRLESTMTEFLDQDQHVRLVYKDLPILGPQSVLGSKALMAAQQQNAYDKLREAIMKLPPDTTLPQIEAAAHQLGLDWPRLQRDMEDPTIQTRIDQNLQLARALDIQGTPALVVGKDLIPGAIDLDDLKKAVAAARHG